MTSPANKTLPSLMLVFLLTVLSACGDSANNKNASSADSDDVKTEIEPTTKLDEQPSSEQVDAAGTLRLQEQLMANMKTLADTQDQVANNSISTDFDNASEQQRREFIDDTLEQTEKANENDAKNLAEKLESSKEVEHAPLEN